VQITIDGGCRDLKTCCRFARELLEPWAAATRLLVRTTESEHTCHAATELPLGHTGT
jgi:hypothetical protein